MKTLSSSSAVRFTRITLALAAVCTAAPAVFAAAPATDAAPTRSMFSMDPAMLNATTLRYETSGVSSSTDDAIASERAELSGGALGEGAGSGTAPTGRRRSYGRSRYEDRLHNADGSTKIAVVAGAGLNVPVGNSGKFYTPSYDIVAGAGYNFSKMFGVLGEFHYDHMGVTGGAIAVEYNNLLNYGATADQIAGLDANAHVLSITANPVVNFENDRSRYGAYITGGVGYYHKTTNFTLPAVGTACDSYYCYQYASNYNFDQASAGGLGVNGGFGLTYKISEFSNERLFLEARYNWIKIDSSNNQDFFPYSRRNTEYVPIVAGIRF